MTAVGSVRQIQKVCFKLGTEFQWRIKEVLHPASNFHFDSRPSSGSTVPPNPWTPPPHALLEPETSGRSEGLRGLRVQTVYTSSEVDCLASP